VGSWNETCAISGLPVQSGDECYVLEFDDTNLIAFCAIESFNDYLRHLKSITFGTYLDSGLLTTERKKRDEVSDGRVFVLKHFWDFASTDKKAKPLIDAYVAEHKERCDNIEAFLTEATEHIKKKWDAEEYSPGFTIYRKDPDMFRGFVAVLFMMPGLRRTFYTAAYRGAQSTAHAWGTMRKMSAEVQWYIDKKIRENSL